MKKQKKLRKIKGYLTVFVSLTMTVMISLYMVLLEGIRQNTIRLETKCITDIGMDSIMAEYHRTLFERYGLFYIDTSYGTNYPSIDITKAHLKQYLRKNLDCHNVKYFPRMYYDLLKINIKDIQMKGVSLATDSGGLSLQRQAIAVMENDMGISYLKQFKEWLSVIEGYGLMNESVEEERKKLQNEYEEKEAQWIHVDIVNPTEEIEKIRRKGVLEFVTNAEDLSGKSIAKEQYLSVRKEKAGTNIGNAMELEELSMTEKLLFIEYILKYTGCYTKEREGAFLCYQTEYILMGADGDIDNLRKVVNKICAIREVANVITLSNDVEKKESVRVLATLLSGVLLVPELQPVFEGTILLGWAYMESLYDVKELLRGNRIELIKEGVNWHCGLEGALCGIVHEKQSEEEEKGLRYEDYLRILLYLENMEDITFRLMDVMEMDIRQTPGNEVFRMDGCVDRITASVTYQSGYGYTYTVEMKKKYK